MSVRLISAAADRRLLDESRRTRSMTWIMAIMLFLTLLAAAFGLATWRGAGLLDRQLAGRLTVQIVEPDPAKRDDQAARALDAIRLIPEVAKATPVDRAELTRLLRPWLGADGADPDLPIPAMIDVDLRTASDLAVDRITAAARQEAPGARVDRHEAWMSPIARFMDTLVIFAAGLVLLMAAATSVVVILVARTGLETHRATIEVMHMLGSTDLQVARLFQRRIALDTLIGGLIGGVVAVGALLFVGGQLSRLGSDLLDGLALERRDWVLLALLPILFALLATLAARLAVLRALRKTL